MPQSEHFNSVARALLPAAAALLCAHMALMAQPMAREGPYWVLVLTGSQPLPAGTRLRISSRGGVTLSGAAEPGLSYALKVLVKARNEADARRLAGAFGVRISKQGAYTVLLVQSGDGLADLRVKAPRTAPEAVVTTTEGGLDLSDLSGAVRGETGGGNISADRIHGSLVARTAGGDITLGTVEGSAHCVTAGGKITANLVRGEADLETGGGDILAQEVDGLAHVSTMAGSIRIRRAGAAVIASTGGGPIDVGQARGLVTARNSGGPVQVGSAAAGVHCENAAGAVHIDNVSGGMRVSTAMGSIIARLLAGKPMDDSFLSTGSGDITVFIPSNVGVTIHAQSELSDSARRIVSDFPGVAVRVEGGQVVAEGKVNGGGPLLRISGSGGSIFIKQQK